jgi:hypothetical protein
MGKRVKLGRRRGNLENKMEASRGSLKLGQGHRLKKIRGKLKKKTERKRKS